MRFALLLLTALPLPSQSLHVYSEFAKIGETGEVVEPEHPREILSPAIARNAFTSFQVVVQVPKGTRYTLYIGQNPEDAVRVTLYRESGDRLDPVDHPYEGESTQILWMDLWAERDAPVRRIKIEPQLSVGSDWLVYPMEVRVMNATVPGGGWPPGSATPAVVMQSFLCGTDLDAGAADESSMARLRFRNAQQDVSLAGPASKLDLKRLIGGCDATPSAELEWYLRIRDYLYRMR